jgi:hypothetical protein
MKIIIQNETENERKKLWKLTTILKHKKEEEKLKFYLTKIEIYLRIIEINSYKFEIYSMIIKIYCAHYFYHFLVNFAVKSQIFISIVIKTH